MTAHALRFLLLFAVAAGAFSATPLVLARLWTRRLSPNPGGAIQRAIYECGLESSGDAWVQFHPGYYLYAILFLVFDVEVIFLLPFAAAFNLLPAGACIAMLVFILLLAEGLAWAWARGALHWT